MGEVKRMYKVILKSGIEKEVIREEREDRTLIGLWIWSQRRREETFINVEDGVIKASEIAMVANPVEVDRRDPDTGHYEADMNELIVTPEEVDEMIEKRREVLEGKETITLQEAYEVIQMRKALVDGKGLDEPTSYGITLEQEIAAAEEEIK